MTSVVKYLNNREKRATMRRSIAIIMSVCMATVLFLAGCGSTNKPNEASQGQGSVNNQQGSGQSNDAIKRVRFVSSESDPPSVEAYKEIIRRFEAENPNIKIDLEILNADQLSTKLISGVAAGVTPDVSQADADLIVDFAKKGFLHPVDDLINETGRDKWQPGSVLNFDGHDWSVPYGGSTTVLWYRKDLFEQYGVKPPTNWAEWLDAAKQLTLDTDGDSKTDIYGMSIPAGQNAWTGYVFLYMLWANGQSMFDKDLNLTFNTPATVETLEQYAELVKQAPPDAPTYSYYETIDAFVSGRTAMGVYFGRLLSKAAVDNPEVEEHTGALQWPAQKLAITGGGYDSYVVYKDSQVKEEALKWLKYLTTSEAAVQFMLTVPGHILPPYHDETIQNALHQDPLLQKHKDALDVLLDSQAFSISPTYESGSIQDGKFVPGNTIINPYINEVMNKDILSQMVQKVVIMGEAPQAAVDWAEKEIQGIVKAAK